MRAEVGTAGELPLSHSHVAQAAQGTPELQLTSTLQVRKIKHIVSVSTSIRTFLQRFCQNNYQYRLNVHL